MTLDEAIEILADFYCSPLKSPTLEQLAAMKLGTEALKEVGRLRRVEEFDPTIMLPGETEE